ncbi:hypothetical protein LT85_2636 [Collimonas arenae]|uniref:Uncharacterized protein n=1 Tax=Collimonas arenae TaxID=279058 RepID=A0A0A1FDU3_9BURK|nr:hypothetical protein LT85_2636 [Collimonas arenae]
MYKFSFEKVNTPSAQQKYKSTKWIGAVVVSAELKWKWPANRAVALKMKASTSHCGSSNARIRSNTIKGFEFAMAFREKIQ